MRFRTALLFMSAFFISSLVSAQTPETPAPWPPDPDALFADGIVWSLVDEMAVSADNPITIDREKRLIHIYDATTETAREYLWPTGKTIADAQMRSDGHVFVSESQYYSPEYTLILNPETGVYRPAESVCDGNAIKALPGEGRWIEVGQSYDNPFLCQTETDEHIKPTGVTLDWNSLIANVDETHLILMYGMTSQFVLYDIATGETLPLGTIPEWNSVDDAASVCEWLTPTKGLICVHNTAFDFMPLNYYAFDLTQPNSLESVFSDWGMIELDNPKRFVSISSEVYIAYRTSGAMWDTPCQAQVYDATGLRTHTLGVSCLPIVWGLDSIGEVYWGGDNFYYLATEEIGVAYPDPIPSSSLYRFDVETETMSKPLLTGEIENILGVSPDEHYIALVVDNNGLVDLPWQRGNYGDKPRSVAILDMHNGEIVYQTEPIGLSGAEDAQWIDDDSLILFSGEIWRIDLDQDKPAVHQTDNYPHQYPYDDLCLSDQRDFMTAYGEAPGLMLVDLATFEAVPFLRGDALKAYSMQTSCYDLNGSLNLRVNPRESRYTTIIYQVTLPQ